MTKLSKLPIGTCPRCGRKATELMINNNPLITSTICFHCILDDLDPTNLQHADFFCRTYNLPFNPDIWIKLHNECGNQVFQQYTLTVLADEANQPNLAYSSSTKDL